MSELPKFSGSEADRQANGLSQTRLLLPGAVIYPHAPDPKLVVDDVLFGAWLTVPAFAGQSRTMYLVGQHSLLVSFLFSDPKLALAGMLCSVPEAVYGRLATPIWDQLQPSAGIIYDRYCAAFRRALFVRENVDHVTETELQLVLERESVVWNRTFQRCVLNDLYVPDDPTFSDVLKRVGADFLALVERVRSGGLGALGSNPYFAEDMLQKLLRLEPIPTDTLEHLLSVRLAWLRKQRREFEGVGEFEPDLVDQFGREALLSDDRAYPPYDPAELQSLVAPPAIAPDRSPGEEDDISEEDYDRAIEGTSREMLGIIGRLREASQAARKVNAERIRRRAALSQIVQRRFGR